MLIYKCAITMAKLVALVSLGVGLNSPVAGVLAYMGLAVLPLIVVRYLWQLPAPNAVYLGLASLGLDAFAVTADNGGEAAGRQGHESNLMSVGWC